MRKLATATCVVALLPISMGALVTTLGAGMAFADWPSSDGQNMLLYPWFRDFADHPDKFIEHGHRLAGMLIGMISVALLVAAWIHQRGGVRVFAAAIVAGVILQGALGGARVLLDRQSLALLHSLTGSAFFSLVIVFRLSCSQRWQQWTQQEDSRLTPLAAAAVAIAPVAVSGQYLLGSLLRHFHMMLDEHLMGAAVVSVAGSLAAFCLVRSENSLLHRSGLAMASLLLLQLLLGAGSFVTRFGLQQIGYVAIVGSASQAVVCSLHTVFGMLLLAASTVGAVALCRLYQAGVLAGLRLDLSPLNDRGATR